MRVTGDTAKSPRAVTAQPERPAQGIAAKRKFGRPTPSGVRRNSSRPHGRAPKMASPMPVGSGWTLCDRAAAMRNCLAPSGDSTRWTWSTNGASLAYRHRPDRVRFQGRPGFRVGRCPAGAAPGSAGMTAQIRIGKGCQVAQAAPDSPVRIRRSPERCDRAPATQLPDAMPDKWLRQRQRRRGVHVGQA